jgi:multidrug efflux pump subunit AcrB
VEGQRLNASIIVQSLLKTPEEFAAIPLRTIPDGSIVRVSDVGARNWEPSPTTSRPLQRQARRRAGHPAGAGANALDTADAVKAKMEEMSRFSRRG